MPDFDIRVSEPNDQAAIATIYPAAFPEEDLLPLVRELLSAGPAVISLVATVGSELVGHVAFTICGIDDGPDTVALLAPLAVTPNRQRNGIGRAIVEAGLQRLQEAGVIRVYVLGDPAYYGRLGFETETQVAPPYPLPDEWAGAWQSLSLGGSGTLPAGTLSVPPVWRDPALWGP